MIKYMFYIIWFINIILVISKKKSKIVTVVSVMISQLLFYYSTNSGDYQNYLNDYQYQKASFEYGYNFLTRIAFTLGLTYNEFLFVLSVACFAIILFVFSKFTNNYHIFFSIYFIYQLGVDINQFRNFLACTILFCYLYSLYRKKRILALILIILAISMHNTMWFYVPLLFIDDNILKNDKLLKFIGLLISLCCVFLKYNSNIFVVLSSFASSLISDTGYEEKIGYFSTMSENGYLVYFVLHAINIFIIIIGNYYLIKNIQDKDKKEQLGRLYHFVLFINIYAILSFPLIILNMSFYRLYRNIFLLNIVFICVCRDSFKERSKHYYKFVIMSIVIFFTYKIPLVHLSSSLNTILNGLDK